MKALKWMRTHPKTLGATAGVVIGAVTLTGMAVAYDGLPTTKVDLNDSGVWLTKSSTLQVGHFNNSSTVIDGGLRTSSEDFDVLQDEQNVLVVDSGNNNVTAIDTAAVALGDTAAIPGDGKAALGRNTTAVLDHASGFLWVVPVSSLTGFDVKRTEPVAKLGKNADVTVGRDGTVYAVSAERSEVVTVPVDAQGAPESPKSSSIGELAKGSQPTITAVGTTPVVLDPQGGVVETPGGIRTEVPQADAAVLQQASEASASVTLANTSHLIHVPLDGGDPVEISSSGQGAPAAPVSLRGCTYGAWSGSARFVRDCAGDSADVNEKIPGAGKATALTFRVNRDVIVLNDIMTGAAWLADDTLQQVDDWSVLTPPEGDNEEDENTTEETVETTLPERSEKNTPPTASDDDYGVRPGGTTLLSVTDNDNDPDGDVLVASLVGKQPKVGEVQPILNGGALQIMVPEDAKGSATFEYKVDDGRGGTDTANVTVTVHGDKVNGAPKPKRQTKLAVEAGGTVSYNVLPDWIDPDGDDIYLRGVTPSAGDEVEFTTDGQLTYRAVASLQGRKKVEIVVADSLGEMTSGTLYVDVRPLGSMDPKTNADHVVTRVDESVTVSPLVNDTSAGREPLRLTRVDDVDGASIAPDFANKQFSFKSQRAGTYYVQYLASAGPKSAIGIVRVDVLDQTESELPPVAVRDVALLPTGKETLLGVLANDSDPGGGVLVVQSVTVPAHSGLSVSVLNHETLRIADQGALDDPVRISYRISNGSQSAEGDVIVVPIPAPSKILPPVAVDDEAVVRAGDVVTIPVLDNDTHPNGDVLHVAPDLVEPLVDPKVGEAFVSQDTVRFRAGSEPGTAYITYEAVDSMGQKDAGYVTVQILPVDVKDNAAPHPRDLTVRTVRGTSTRIAIPLDGIDADGDSVELVGLDDAPSKGQIAETAQNYLMYEAFAESSGVDAFTYKVRDRLGKEGTATIRVGIAPPETANQSPYAVKDAVSVRPGRSVAVPVLANDSDPDGDKISIAKKLETPDIDGFSAKVSGDRVVVDVPDRELETSLQYTLRDARGAEATAPLMVTVDPDVPLLAPIARDDRVLQSDLDKGTTVDLDILANDEDPDGTVQGLDVDVEKGGTLLENRKVRVTVGAERQLIRYTVTDQDGLTASAFIFVPALAEIPPTVSLPTTKPVQVKSGETKVLPLADYVTVTGGGQVRITEAAKVSAVNSDGSDLVQDEHTLVYTSKKGYFGKDALTFEVTDGTGPDDPKGRKATLTIPIQVLPPENQPPEFVDGQLDVAPGEDATSLDLAGLTTDPDEGDAAKIRYSITGQPGEGVSARLDGTKLLVQADSDARKGTATTIELSITDGTTKPITGRVTATVSASTRSLPVASPDTVDEADQGETISVPVLDNDINPFPETPLKLVDAVPESGDGSVGKKGDQVVVTPDKDFVGVMVIRYRIQDATKDADREVDGRLTVTVQGVPDAPGQPTVSSVQNRTVVLSWSPPANNGAEITEYTVKSVKGSAYSKTCTATTCTLDGLTNNVEYTFQVTATNRVGEGPASPTSAPARPDVRPDTPAAPKLVFGDKSLKVSWTAPKTSGSPVTSYTLQISPAPPSGSAEKTGVTGTSLTWTGLENGASYQVRVRAHNSAPDPSSFSTWSPAEIPAGKPAAPAKPTTAELSPVGTQAQMEVRWSAPANNGDAISGYELQVLRGSTVVQTLHPAAGAKTQAIRVDTSETGYTFKIKAKNKAGYGAFSPLSAARRGVTKPDAPTGLKVTPKDKYLAVSFTRLTTAQRNGAKATEIVYQYRLDSGSWKGGTSWDGSKITGLTNGTTYKVSIRAVANVGGSTYAGPASSSVSGKPYGTPFAPTVTAKNNGTTVTLGWNGNNSDNGYPVKVQIRTSKNGGSWSGWSSVAVKGSKTTASGYSTTWAVQARATASPGGTSPVSAKASAKTDAPPPPPKPTATLGPGSAVSGCSAVGGGSCHRYKVTTNKYFKAGDYKIECWDGGKYSSNNAGYPVYIPSGGSVEVGCYSGYYQNKELKIIGGNPSSAYGKFA